MSERAMSGRVIVVGMMVLGSCGHSGVAFPWPATGKMISSDSADVLTVNKNYHRGTSQVLVRQVSRPTRANLDYAAYDANFMNADPEPEGAMRASTGKRPDTSHPFGGALESLTGTLGSLPLTPDERTHPLALAPLVELLTSKHIPGGDTLEDTAAKVRAEDWGLGGGPQLVRQTAVAAFLHDAGKDKPTEIWVKIELAPWFKEFVGIPDADGDGYGEVYGRVPVEALGDKIAALSAFIREDYAGRALTSAEVKKWAHQLASYWYPSYNTDLVAPGESWPDADTEPQIVAELGGQRFASPAVVMRGKPQGKPVYNVFLVTGSAGDNAEGGTTGSASAAKAPPKLSLPRTTPSPQPNPLIAAIKSELATHGGSWNRWAAEVAPLNALMKSKLKAIPKGAKAVAGDDGFLFFGQSMAYATGGDLEKQKRGRNPVPIILQFKKILAERGVDLLFVPVPTKEEIFPDKIGTSPDERRAGTELIGKVVNPFERKFLLDLGEMGVEGVDLLPVFLRARAADESKDQRIEKRGASLYQAQDTHWTNRGLELAARAVADRIKTYPWYKDIAAHRKAYKTKESAFSRHGDLHSRLPEADKARYQPENLLGDQVLTSDGALYEDDPDSAIVVLGDSFTGVYELMDCEHAGVSAHIAKEIGYPVDLVMSYGGGPNVRQKLLRRGLKALESKKWVVWMMTARDLYDFWEGWEPVSAK
jgi:alginate O-acetyltransferase complex protein AlgJ